MARRKHLSSAEKIALAIGVIAVALAAAGFVYDYLIAVHLGI